MNAEDLDSNETSDRVVANRTTDDLSELLGVGDGIFAPAASFAAGSEPRQLTTGDFNIDGIPALAVAA